MRGSDGFRLATVIASWAAVGLLGIVLTSIGIANGPDRVWDVTIGRDGDACSASTDELIFDTTGERLYCVVQGGGRFAPDPQPPPRPWTEDEIQQVQSAVRANPGNAQAAADAEARRIAASHAQTGGGRAWMAPVGIIVVIIAVVVVYNFLPITEWLHMFREARARYWGDE